MLAWPSVLLVFLLIRSFQDMLATILCVFPCMRYEDLLVNLSLIFQIFCCSSSIIWLIS